MMDTNAAHGFLADARVLQATSPCDAEICAREVPTVAVARLFVDFKQENCLPAHIVHTWRPCKPFASLVTFTERQLRKL